MGWITKKSYGWEMKRMAWPIVSLMAFLPLPIHLFPIAFIAQGSKAKVRAWVYTGIFFLVAELIILGLFLAQFKHFDLGLIFTSVSTFVAYLALYLVGNALLIRNTKPYMQRLELSDIMELEWTNSIRTAKTWKPNTINSPQTFVAQLLAYRNGISNYGIKQNIDKIINSFRTIIDKDMQKAELLVVRHQTILSLLSQYENIQKSKINNNVTNTSKLEIENVIGQATIAVENELTNQYQTELLGVSAEKDVYLQQLKNRNLIQ
ncbi:MAG: hypothetical protein DI598_03895 [Pseudopedobacter saltans]|uniref:Uncharacterized protein n=1 Tax=Pseudopedobacter saltans TaxID=151895 RepID=A0A2W5HBY0_9SPHI|nr:MAG: hypothetical protein DI598_03895 [Pseudopedobacter saltans]